MKEFNLKLNEYKAKLIFYALNEEIKNLKNSTIIIDNTKYEINVIELRNTIATLIQNN
tara:strand:- start:103 stop:276 length:174 start_codon:yes stop_codon:yes gene_type:complete